VPAGAERNPLGAFLDRRRRLEVRFLNRFVEFFELCKNRTQRFLVGTGVRLLQLVAQKLLFGFSCGSFLSGLFSSLLIRSLFRRDLLKRQLLWWWRFGLKQQPVVHEKARIHPAAKVEFVLAGWQILRAGDPYGKRFVAKHRPPGRRNPSWNSHKREPVCIPRERRLQSAEIPILPTIRRDLFIELCSVLARQAGSGEKQ